MTRVHGYRGIVPVTAIVAADLNDVIGVGNDLPWRLPTDLKRFKRITSGHTCITGSRTQASIVARLGGPLPGRQTVILSHQQPVESSAQVSYATYPLQAAYVAEQTELTHCAPNDTPEVFVIGGAQTYAVMQPFVSTVLLTRVKVKVVGDTHLPDGWLNGFDLVSSVTSWGPEDQYPMAFEEWKRVM